MGESKVPRLCYGSNAFFFVLAVFVVVVVLNMCRHERLSWKHSSRVLALCASEERTETRNADRDNHEQNDEDIFAKNQSRMACERGHGFALHLHLRDLERSLVRMRLHGF